MRPDKFNVGDIIKFDIEGTELKGTGEILGKASNGIIPHWIVLLKDRYTKEIIELSEKGLVIQENLISLLKLNDAKCEENVGGEK